MVRATAGGTIDIAKVEASRTPFAPVGEEGHRWGSTSTAGTRRPATLLNTQLMQFAGNTWGLTYEASVRGLAYSGTAFRRPASTRTARPRPGRRWSSRGRG